MTTEEFAVFRSALIRSYAEDKVRAGNWKPEEAAAKTEEETGRLLPDGLATPGHHLQVIENERVDPVGHLWYGLQSDGDIQGLFIWDIEIRSEFQRQGYAAAALRELENVAKQAGADRISLHVFAHNEGAISLYRKLGYEPTNLVLSKRLMTPASGASAEITAKESGRNRRTTSSPPPKTFISDLRPGRVATIEATVTKLEPVREVEQRLGGKKKVP
ncbi:acetyltransferase, GNAT family [mine drainage metagenome]|uniref:Acetyltransferase, GNAT family n=1 Tax=mine drainage metagenome TaxID=410659 RepID=T0ZVZ7_9ZZZZ